VDGTFMDKYGGKCDLLPETEQVIWELGYAWRNQGAW
jgi:hypothetical protein